ncbi:MAG TPA: hypothetical protein VG962_00350 [Steroidobacteraceae bacterium]|nr:hypothetical protein [Steroidobacteraceae bacterium]
MSLRRRIIWLLVIKLAALTLLYGLFFAPSQRIKVDAHRIDSQWFDSTHHTGE